MLHLIVAKHKHSVADGRDSSPDRFKEQPERQGRLGGTGRRERRMKADSVAHLVRAGGLSANSVAVGSVTARIIDQG